MRWWYLKGLFRGGTVCGRKTVESQAYASVLFDHALFITAHSHPTMFMLSGIFYMLIQVVPSKMTSGLRALPKAETTLIDVIHSAHAPPPCFAFLT